jgi:hypothetical protein
MFIKHSLRRGGLESSESALGERIKLYHLPLKKGETGIFSKSPFLRGI